jgi:nicotinamidase/pyrazinamidase
VNKLRAALEPKVQDFFVSKDWHPADHVSFVSNHPGAVVFSEITLDDGTSQVMWPPHCVENTPGAEVSPTLVLKVSDFIIHKGTRPNIDSYSAFGSANGIEKTPLLDTLQKRGITHLIVVGLAFDFCVSFTAKDAAKYGFHTSVVLSATGCTSDQGFLRERNEMVQAGVQLLDDVPHAIEWVNKIT